MHGGHIVGAVPSPSRQLVEDTAGRFGGSKVQVVRYSEKRA
jgi:hypothetical protein